MLLLPLLSGGFFNACSEPRTKEVEIVAGCFFQEIISRQSSSCVCIFAVFPSGFIMLFFCCFFVFVLLISCIIIDFLKQWRNILRAPLRKCMSLQPHPISSHLCSSSFCKWRKSIPISSCKKPSFIIHNPNHCFDVNIHTCTQKAHTAAAVSANPRKAFRYHLVRPFFYHYTNHYFPCAHTKRLPQQIPFKSRISIPCLIFNNHAFLREKIKNQAVLL